MIMSVSRRCLWDRFVTISLVAQAPITVALTITTPVIDLDENDKNWKQYLHLLQCLVAPVFFVMGAGSTLHGHRGSRSLLPDTLFATVGFTEVLPNYPVWLMALVMGGVLALLVWAMTRASQPPKAVAVRLRYEPTSL